MSDEILTRLDRIIELLTPPEPRPRAEVDTPLRCKSVAASLCALRSEDARINRATFADPASWACKGCRIVYTSR